MIVAKLNVTKFDKSKFFKGEKGVCRHCLDRQPRRHGNDGFVAQSISKEEREAGVKGAVIGSFRRFDQKTKTAEKRLASPVRQAEPEDDDIPF